MSVFLRHIAVLVTVLLLVGFRWSLMFGELDWDKVNAVIDQEYPMIAELSVEELQALLDSGRKVHLVDVREPEEYRVSHLPGAVLSSSFQPESLDKQVMIVAYCSVGLRSAKYVQQLQKQGFSRVYNLRGSLFQWANQGYPLTVDGQRATRVHPYNERWGKLLRAELHSYSVGQDGGSQRP